MNLAKTLMRLKRYLEAEMVLQHVRNTGDFSPEDYVLLAWCMIAQQRDIPRALDIVRKHLENFPPGKRILAEVLRAYGYTGYAAEQLRGFLESPGVHRCDYQPLRSLLEAFETEIRSSPAPSASALAAK